MIFLYSQKFFYRLPFLTLQKYEVFASAIEVKTRLTIIEGMF